MLQELKTAKDYDVFDIIAYGLDGEYIARDIAKKFKEKKYNREAFLSDSEMLKNIKGIIYKKDGKVVRNQPKENIKDSRRSYHCQQEIYFQWRDIYLCQINIKNFH